MKPDNLYEDAYYGLAQYNYAILWGTESQQMKGLLRAVAEEQDADYLPKRTFAGALRALFALQAKQGYLAESLVTWAKFLKLGDKEAIARLQPLADRILAARTDDKNYGVSAEIDETPWSFSLYKQRFAITVQSGHVEDVSLRCQKKYVFFKFEPGLQYRVSANYGACCLALTGDPGTTFQLAQF